MVSTFLVLADRCIGGKPMWTVWRERFSLYMRKRNFSGRTVNDYGCQLGFFFRFLSGCAVTDISQVTREVLQQYQNHLYYYEKKGKRLSFDTQNCKLSVVKSFFRFLAAEGYVPYDPASTLVPPRRKKGNLPRGIMSTREVGMILEAPEGDDPLTVRDRAILEVLYGTGIRNTELRCLTIFDADLGNGQLRIRDGKGKKERIVPLGEWAVHYLERYIKEARPALVRDSSQTLLFVSKNGRHITAANLIWMVKKYTTRASLKKCVTPHCFRHSCASHMLRNKADLRHIQEMLGHASVQTTQIYTKVELSQLKEVHARCHPRKKMGFTH
jgi:integrase/recombinase XerD